MCLCFSKKSTSIRFFYSKRISVRFFFSKKNKCVRAMDNESSSSDLPFDGVDEFAMKMNDDIAPENPPVQVEHTVPVPDVFSAYAKDVIESFKNKSEDNVLLSRISESVIDVAPVKRVALKLKVIGSTRQFENPLGYIVVPLHAALADDSEIEKFAALHNVSIDNPCSIVDIQLVGVHNQSTADMKMGVNAYFKSVQLFHDLNNNKKMEMPPELAGDEDAVARALCLIADVPAMVSDDPMLSYFRDQVPTLDNSFCYPRSLLHKCNGLREWLVFNTLGINSKHSIVPRELIEKEGDIEIAFAPNTLAVMMADICHMTDEDAHDSVYAADSENLRGGIVMKKDFAKRVRDTSFRFCQIVKNNTMMPLKDIELVISGQPWVSTGDDVPFDLTLWLSISVAHTEYENKTAAVFDQEMVFFNSLKNLVNGPE